MKTIRLGLLGCGNIGSGVVRLLAQQSEALLRREGLCFEIRRVLVRDLAKPRATELPREVFTTQPERVTDGADIDVVLEFLGGEEPAASLLIRALENGKPVVTANKMALARRWEEIFAAARQGGTGIFFEAAVGGAIPVIRAITDSLQANRITGIMGIINGTTNYILSRMSAEGLSYQAALGEAQRLGLAEPDPTADVEGYDSASKLSILTSLAFRRHIPPEAVYREGISGLTPMDIACGREMGLTLKLLAVGREGEDGVEARVHPAFVPAAHPLAGVNGAFNAIFLDGHACGEMMLYGRGAGDAPTASAVVSDLVHAARGETRPLQFEGGRAAPLDDWQSGYFIRLRAKDQPGVLSMASGRLAEEGVSIASMMQKGGRDKEGFVQLVILTHRARERAVRRALSRLDPEMVKGIVVIRVEGAGDL